MRQRVRRKLFQLFRHHAVVDMSWLTDERAICLAARLFLRDNEVVPTEQEVKRVRGLLQNYLDPEQQRVVTRLLKETASPRGGMRDAQEGLM